MSETFRTSITGIDGAGKDSVSKQACENMYNEGLSSIVKLSRPILRVDEDGTNQIFSDYSNRMDKAHNFADKHHVKPLIVAVNAMNVMYQSRILERKIASDDETELLISARDWVIDPVVYAEYYLPRLSNSMSLENRLKIMQQLTGINRELIIQLKVDPETAVKRIEERMQLESETSEDVMRLKWQHVHENIDDLNNLQKGYSKAFDKYHEMHPDLRIIEIGTDDKTRDEVAYLSSLAIKSSMNGLIEPGERITF